MCFSRIKKMVPVIRARPDVSCEISGKILELKEACYFDVIVEDVASIRKLRLKFNDEVAINLFGMELAN